jgi:hypothetical protein
MSIDYELFPFFFLLYRCLLNALQPTAEAELKMTASGQEEMYGFQ